MLKKIWAVVSEKEFYAFQDRAKAEGVGIGDALVALVRVYTQGGVIVLPKENKHHKSTGVDYTKISGEV